VTILVITGSTGFKHFKLQQNLKLL
jgi:hypothetical protein